MKAYTKDIGRSIRKGGKRFFALMMITALGVCMLTGLRAACQDLRFSADDFFDKQNLFDITIVSTYGLTDEDVEALAGLPEIEEAEGAYSETVFTTVEGKNKQAAMNVLSETGMNEPYLLEGEWPAGAGEILVTEKYLHETGKEVGDTLLIEEKQEESETANFLYTEYTICGVVIDVTNINSVEGAVAFRDNSTTDYTFFVLPEAVKSDIYTAVYLTLTDCDELLCYSDAYEAKVKEVVDYLESEIKADREQARYEEVTGDAYEEIADAQKEMEEAFAEAEQKIADAQKEIEASRKELEDGENKLSDAQKELLQGKIQLLQAEIELENGEKEYAAGVAELEDAETQITEAEEQVKEGEEQLEAIEAVFSVLDQTWTEANEQIASNYAQLYSGIEDQLSEKQTEYENAQTEVEKQLIALEIQTLETSLENLKEQEEEAYQKLEENSSEYLKTKAELEAKRAELEAGKEELEDGKAELASGKQKLADARIKLDNGWAEVEKGWDELEAGQQQIDQNKNELEEGKEALADGQAALEENASELENEKENALEEIEKARQEVADLKMTAWYISTRTSLGGYGNIKSDADCIEAIGNAFPVIFLTIAILISLTTMSRMVEEDRGLIGTYKALGFTDREIRRKYMIYALLACIFGGILGDLMGFILLPEIVFIIFGVMYQLPAYLLSFDAVYGIGGIILFIIGIVGASMISCKTVLSNTPATLMRAKPPTLGSRVLLERITPLWSSLSFLNKVTARNLFRYKKRLFMTLFGIAGCTALLVAGFTIKDTVTELMPLQYEETYQYDAMIVADDNEKLVEYLEEESSVRRYISTMITNVKVSADSGKEETVQLIVVPEDVSLQGYIRLYDKAGEKLKLTDEDVFTTINLSKVVGYEKEDVVTIQTLELEQAKTRVTGITMNYMGNNVYMTQAKYEELFGEFSANGALIILKGDTEAHDAFIEDMEGRDGILSAVGTDNLRANFEPAFQILNMVVYIVIVLAAALAFVVLFTLSTTNISERERELATIKVLGFYDPEVHAYVNKETVILTSLGILLGLPIGKFLGEWLMAVLNLSAIYFETTTYAQSYVYAAVMSIIFAFMVNFITDRSLDKINPVEALKSVE